MKTKYPWTIVWVADGTLEVYECLRCGLQRYDIWEMDDDGKDFPAEEHNCFRKFYSHSENVE